MWIIAAAVLVGMIVISFAVKPTWLDRGERKEHSKS